MTVPAGPGPGGLPRLQVPWLPTPDEVLDVLSQREFALDVLDTVKIDDQIQARAGCLLAEVPDPLSERLWQCAHDYVLFSAASVLEDRCFPEQSLAEGSNAERLDRRAGIEMSRLRLALGEDAAGAESLYAGTIPLGLPGTRRDRWRASRRYPGRYFYS